MAPLRSIEIVATLGPASWNLVAPLCDAGATTFRLNASHMEVTELAHRATKIRSESQASRVVIDLQGAKMRVGDFIGRAIRMGERARFSLDGSGGAIPIPHREIFKSIRNGQTLSCDDDRLRFRVESAGAETLDTIALAEGILQPRKGINVLEHPVLLQDLTGFDQERIKATAHLDGVAYAFSFMSDGGEVTWIRRHAPGCEVIGKIERREATGNMAAIANSVDSIWICRGDLGAQLGVAPMARWISAFDPGAHGCSVLMAGQVMEHLTAHAEPTRAEVCHLYDLLVRGYAGFVLSDETAIGADPVHAVATLYRLVTSFRF